MAELGRAPEPATFHDAPGDRGTEIHVETGKPWTLAKAKEALRRFKQQFETGEIPRSDSAPMAIGSSVSSSSGPRSR